MIINILIFGLLAVGMYRLLQKNYSKKGFNYYLFFTLFTLSIFLAFGMPLLTVLFGPDANYFNTTGLFIFILVSIYFTRKALRGNCNENK